MHAWQGSELRKSTFITIIAHPGSEVDNVRRLELLKDGLGLVHAPQVTVLAAQEDVLLLLLRLFPSSSIVQEASKPEKGKCGAYHYHTKNIAAEMVSHLLTVRCVAIPTCTIVGPRTAPEKYGTRYFEGRGRDKRFPPHALDWRPALRVLLYQVQH